MTLSEELEWRGFVNQTTLKAITELDLRKFTFYFGVDPSADSMQIGNLAAAMMARHFVNYGHKAVLLVGGATGMIGDPKTDQERTLKSLDEIAKNKAGIARQYKTIFNGMDFELVDNYDWFKDIKYLDFLREIGKHFSMTQLLDRDFVKTRVGEGKSGLSYAEFSYSLIQGYDFLHLFRKNGVTLQLCGADQWGNSVSGVDLIRKLENKEAHVFSAPLIINKATGVKFGKSEGGAVWLDEAKTSVFSLYQFLLNTDDETVIDLLKTCTLLTKETVDDLKAHTKQSPGERAAQKTLAFEVTKLVHGEQRAETTKSISEVLFGTKAFAELSKIELEELTKELPPVPAESLIDALVKSGLAVSNSEANRFIDAGAVAINGEKIIENTKLDAVKKNNGYLLLKRGKNSFALVK